MTEQERDAVLAAYPRMRVLLRLEDALRAERHEVSIPADEARLLLRLIETVSPDAWVRAVEAHATVEGWR